MIFQHSGTVIFILGEVGIPLMVWLKEMMFGKCMREICTPVFIPLIMNFVL